MKISFTLGLLLLFCLGVAIPAQRPQQSDPCPGATSQAEMNNCAGRAFKAADATLNRVYDQLIAKLEPAGRAKLKEAELAWIKYRDATCDYEGSRYEGGTMRPMIEGFCLARVTNARTTELRQEIKDFDQ
jgi:uncharacterized protein YecT (DUF1311 family)